jgi:hypothetical protein
MKKDAPSLDSYTQTAWREECPLKGARTVVSSSDARDRNDPLTQEDIFLRSHGGTERVDKAHDKARDKDEERQGSLTEPLVGMAAWRANKKPRPKPGFFV